MEYVPNSEEEMADSFGPQEGSFIFLFLIGEIELKNKKGKEIKKNEIKT